MIGLGSDKKYTVPLLELGVEESPHCPERLQTETAEYAWNCCCLMSSQPHDLQHLRLEQNHWKGKQLSKSLPSKAGAGALSMKCHVPKTKTEIGHPGHLASSERFHKLDTPCWGQNLHLESLPPPSDQSWVATTFLFTALILPCFRNQGLRY